MSKTAVYSALESFYMKGRVEGISRKRMELYDYVFKNFSQSLGVKCLEEVTRDDIRGYIACLQERKLAKATVMTHFNIIKAFFNFCLRENFLEDTPLKNVKPPKVPRQFPYVLSDQQVEDLLKAPNQKTFEGFKNYVLIMMFLDTGLRLNELAGLGLQNMNLQ